MKNPIRNLMAFALCLMAVSLTACTTTTEAPGGPTPVDNNGYMQLRDPLTVQGALQGEPSDARNFMIVLDGSGSMAGSPIEQAKQALHAYVDQLPKDREINLGLVVFDGSGIRTAVELGSAASKNRSQFLEQVDSVQAGGSTPLANAMNEGTDSLLKQAQRQLNYGDYRMIVVTDGAPDPGQDLDAACSAAASYGFGIYTIGFNIDDGHPLKNWATSYETADSAESLATKLQNTLAEPDKYVAPTYSPTK